MDRRLARRVAASWLAIFMLVTTCNAVYAIRYGYNPSQTTATVRTPAVQLQTGTAGSSTVSNAVYAAVSVTSSAIPLYYVPVTLTNSQGSATPNPFQVLIRPNPSLYSKYEASDLGNIRFCADAFCTTLLYSWLEGCGTSSPYGACSTSSTSAAFWVKLTSAISSGGGTLTIYMAFLSTSTHFDGNVAGESPTMTGTYGQYDNGANVFSFYDNFAGTTLSSKWTPIIGSSGASITVNNGLTVTTTSTGSTAYAFVISATQAYPAVAEAYTSSGNSILGVATTKSLNGFVAPYSGYSMDFYAPIGGDDVEYEASSGSGTQLHVIPQTTFPTGVWQVTWSATGSEYFADGAGGTYPASNSGTTIANYGIYVGQSNGVIASSVFSWARMRAYPPGNAMPSASFGSVTSAANGVILTFTNYGSSSWLANLAVVTSSNTARLNNLTLSFQSPYSKQVVLGTGVTNQNSGPQVTLAASATISIVMGVTVSSSGTSTVTLALKIQSPSGSGATSVYCYDVISLAVN